MEQQPARDQNFLIQVRGKLWRFFCNEIPHALQAIRRRRKRLAVAMKKLQNRRGSCERLRRSAILFCGMFQPGQRFRLGKGKPIEGEDQFGCIRFIAAQRIHERGKAAALFGIALFRNFIPSLLLHHPRFRIIRHAEGRIQPGFMEMAVQHLCAEGVERGNICARSIAGGSMKPGARLLVRRVFRCGEKPGLYTLFHFGCRCIGKGNAKKFAYGSPLRNQTHETLG